MYEPFDVYVDQFTLGGGPYGVSLSFSRSNPKPPVPGSVPQPAEIGVIRMSLEHFKLMAFVIKRQVQDIESQLGIDIPIPVRLLSDLRIAPEDWEKFWQKEK